MTAITVKHLGPTNHKGARIKFSTRYQTRTISRDYAHTMGYTAQDVREFIKEAFPLFGIENLTGPHDLDSERDVWTFTAT